MKPKPGTISWSVIPSTASGPQADRQKFNYVNIKPGSKIADHVAIVNRSTRTVAFTVYATDASGTTQQNVLTFLPAAKKPTDIGSWVRLPHGVSKLNVVIPAKTAVIEPFKISVPHTATPGDHTGGMIASVSFARKGPNGAEVTEDQRIAVPIEMRITGPLHAKLSVQSISGTFGNTVNPFGDGSATVAYSLRNTGNVRLTGTQAVSVTGPFGIKVKIKAKQLQLPTVLPGKSVRIVEHTSGLYPAGPLTANVHVTPANPSDAPPLHLPLANTGGSASLFAVPWGLILLIVLLAGGGVGLWQLWKWRRRQLRETLTAIAESAREETEKRMSSESTPATQSQSKA